MGCCESRTGIIKPNIYRMIEEYPERTSLKTLPVDRISRLNIEIKHERMSKSDYENALEKIQLGLPWSLFGSKCYISKKKLIIMLIILSGDEFEVKSAFLRRFLKNEPRDVMYYLEVYYELVYSKIPHHCTSLHMILSTDKMNIQIQSRCRLGHLILSSYQSMKGNLENIPSDLLHIKAEVL